MSSRIVFITGASRGIGQALAETFAAQGDVVAACARTGAELRDRVAALPGDGHLALVADVTDETALAHAVQAILDRHGRIDVLINNAGIGRFGPVAETATNDWDAVMDVNVRGTFLATRAVLPSMTARRQGHLVTIASDVSKRTFEGGALYCASKYAQDAFLSGLRKEVRALGIKVSVVYPGLVDTFFGDSPQGAAYKADWLRPQDVADAVAYLVNTPAHVVVDELMLHPLTQAY